MIAVVTSMVSGGPGVLLAAGHRLTGECSGPLGRELALAGGAASAGPFAERTEQRTARTVPGSGRGGRGVYRLASVSHTW